KDVNRREQRDRKEFNRKDNHGWIQMDTDENEERPTHRQEILGRKRKEFNRRQRSERREPRRPARRAGPTWWGRVAEPTGVSPRVSSEDQESRSKVKDRIAVLNLTHS